MTSRLEKEDKWKKVLTLQRKRMAISLITACHLYKVDKWVWSRVFDSQYFRTRKNLKRILFKFENTGINDSGIIYSVNLKPRVLTNFSSITISERWILDIVESTTSCRLSVNCGSKRKMLERINWSLIFV